MTMPAPEDMGLIARAVANGYHTNGNSSGGYIYYCDSCGRTLLPDDGSQRHGCLGLDEAGRRMALHSCDVVVAARAYVAGDDREVTPTLIFGLLATWKRAMRCAHKDDIHYWPTT